MARKTISRSLPPPLSVFGPFKGFPRHLSSQALLTDKLRGAARKLRTRHERAFYSMREIAAFFRLPLRTVALAYERLELEGLLNRIRGSQTLLTGKTLLPSKPVKAVVGIPLWLHAFVVSPYSRLLHRELEERLRKDGFVADFIFFREEEANSLEFTERLLRHNLDFILWHTPHPMARQQLMALKDRGIRQVLIQPSNHPSGVDLPTYYQDWQTAYVRMASDWKKKGFTRVIVPEPAYVSSKKEVRSFSSILHGAGLEVILVKGDASSLKKEVSRQTGKKAVIAFLDQLGAEKICSTEPVLIESLMQRCRLAFCRGPIRLPYFECRKSNADLVGFSAVEVAARICKDLKNNRLPGKSTACFQAAYEPNVPFAAFDKPL